jgi:hypothetical protein
MVLMTPILSQVRLFIKTFYFVLILLHILQFQAQNPPSQTITKTILSKEVVIITGNFSLNGKLTNIAEYDLLEAE